jgi:nitroreductase
MQLWKRIRPYIRIIYRFLYALKNFGYDFKRFYLYSGWKENLKDVDERSYKLAMVYHGLEKSLSYKKRKPDSGWKNAYEILNILEISNKSNTIGFHDKAGKFVLEEFINLDENINSQKSIEIRNRLKLLKFNSIFMHGYKNYSKEDFRKGLLENPENFFLSRYSLREFNDSIVSEEKIQHAIQLAMKTPSACNRQAWHIYHTSQQKIKNQILEFQSGNKPFGEKIPNLLVITSDIKAFFSAEEHYQHWIDGGMLSMSIIYALHSLGIASCPLNWSQSSEKDKKFREEINIKDNHTIIMLLAVGYPDEDNKVCISERRPIDEIYTTL